MPLKKAVALAMERTISEIITPVVERSVTIACMTTQELILKVCHYPMTLYSHSTMYSSFGSNDLADQV